MEPISAADIQQRIERDNPWWDDPKTSIREAAFPRRVYFEPFKTLALNFEVQRAAVLLGPRRVGKTVMLRQLVHHAILDGVRPRCILYASIDAPVYSGISLEKFVRLLPEHSETDRCLVIFDEIQYLRDWEFHLKDLVDALPHVKFIATGSAAAAPSLEKQRVGCRTIFGLYVTASDLFRVSYVQRRQ
jgi:predicted AAA+ superfamily ATPase